MIVRFLECIDAQVTYGGHDDPRKDLTVGKEYAISSVMVHSFCTSITLYGYEGKFNSVCFALVGASEFAEVDIDG